MIGLLRFCRQARAVNVPPRRIVRSAHQIFKVPEGSRGPPLPSLDAVPTKSASSMLQYIHSVQLRFPEAVVMAQVGSFMELYFDQAIKYGPLLNLKVARKHNQKSPVNGQEHVYMAGFPLHNKERYEKMLIKDWGKTVVTLMQDSKHVMRGGSEEEKRPISRVLTPGTLLDESFVDQNSNNYLASVIASNPRGVCLMWVDVASGNVKYQSIKSEDLGNALARIAPLEVLVDRNSVTKDFVTETVKQYAPKATISPFKFPPLQLWNTRASHAGRFRFEKLHPDMQKAFVGLLSYIETCMPELPIEIQEPEPFTENDVMQLDSRARAALEISATSTGSTKGSLLNTIRRTRTLSGSRLFQEWFAAPLQDPKKINERLDKVQFFLDQSRATISDIQLRLSEMPDGPRILQKLWLSRINPLDLVAFARSVSTLQTVAELMLGLEKLPREWHRPFSTLVDSPRKTADLILETVNMDAISLGVDESEKRVVKPEEEEVSAEESSDAVLSQSSPSSTSASKTGRKKSNAGQVRKSPKPSFSYAFEPATNRDYKPVLNASASPRLQEIYSQHNNFAVRELEILAQLQQNYGPSVELRWSPSHQFHVNIILNGKNEPDSTVLLARNKKSAYLSNPEWTALGNERLKLSNQLREEEERILDEFRQEILTQHLSPMRKLYSVIDEIDVQMSFATLAMERRLVRPEVVQDPDVFEIENGRHITVETGLALGGFAPTGFVANDCDLSSPQRVCMITGPNMGGKSTFIRQSAIIALLAHVGSFVPAKRAKIGIVDRIFCRIGAGDDLYSGRSTFMVEMLETAIILNNATSRSLAIIDEVGRGTSGGDGLAIAFASIKHLVLRTKCRTLFATHYGQEIWDALSSLVSENSTNARGTIDHTTEVTDGIKLLQASLQVNELGEPIFDYKLKPGISSSSCGLLIAEMAGFPKHALDDAKQLVEKKS